MSELPPGFTLDTEGPPDLPEGFTLDSETPSQKGIIGNISDRVRRLWENPPRGPSIVGGIKTALGDIKSAVETPYYPGLRREDVTDIPDVASVRNVSALSNVIGSPILSGAGPSDPAIAPITKAASYAMGAGTAFPVAGPVLGSGAVAPIVRQASTPAIEAAGRIGVEVPRFLGSESRTLQHVAQGLKSIPGPGERITTSTQKVSASLGDVLKDVEAQYGTGNVESAGIAARDAINNWVTDISVKLADRAYKKVDKAINPSVTAELEATRGVVADIAAKRQAAALPLPGGAVDTVLAAVQRPGGLTYEGAKTLRSDIGESLTPSILPQGKSKSELKQIYGGLTDDIRSIIETSGGQQAAAKWDAANSLYAKIADRREQLAGIVGVKGDLSGEAVFSRIQAMAGEKSTANAARLELARKAMGSEAWNEIASGVVSRMGRDREGNFSPERFLTAWGKLSDRGKELLFKSTGRGELARSLDDLVKVSSAFSDKITRFGNPSGTGQHVGVFSQVMLAVYHPLKFLAANIGGHSLSLYLSRPATAALLPVWVKTYSNVMLRPNQASLAAYNAASKNLALKSGDPELYEKLINLRSGAMPASAKEQEQK